MNDDLIKLSVPSRKVLLIVGIILIALNLRAAIASVGPVIGLIRNEMDISNGTAGLLTTLPLLTFAVISSVAPKLGARFGLVRSMFIGMLLLTIGIVLRSTGLFISLFIGTALAGIGVAVCNVLIPGMVKNSFSGKNGLMTGGYILAMGFSGGIASGVSYPMATIIGWNASLLIWAGLSVLALILWFPQVIRKDHIDTYGSVKTDGSVMKSRVAWEVTLFIGLQAFIFYTVMAWLPEILTSLGYSKTFGGWMLSLIQLLGLPSMFLIPIIADRLKDQKPIVWIIGGLDIMGFSLLLYGGNMTAILLSMILIGVAQGAAISLSLSFFNLRTKNVQEASNLSGMAQSFGYLLAAIGPFFMGVLFDFYHSWNIPLIVCLFLTLLLVKVGLGASRNRFVFSERVDERIAEQA